MKTVKRLFALIGLTIAVFIIGVILFVSLAPQFGRVPEGADLEKLKKSQHYQNGVFVNLIETSMEVDISSMPGMLADFINPPDGKNPNKPLPTKWSEGNVSTIDSIAYITWFGHSAVMLEIDNKTVLIDPMLGPSCAPVSFMTKRFKYEEPIALESLPMIDVIIISHDHYDHLDYETIVKLKSKTSHFFTALGVGSHLKHWGIAGEKITELDWWESANYKGLKITAAPARHFSGRAINDRNKTQWASWCVKGKNQNIYFSGDGGYGSHFKDIGDRLGPFDFAMLENGQYNKQWAAIHMMPEQSVQAGIDVKGKLLMPIHWGAFDLAPHVWQDPIVRFTAKAKELNKEYVTPVIGERFALGTDKPQQEWWKMVE